MNPAFGGLVTATAWGTADFIAHYTGRNLGHVTALFGMTLVSGLAFVALVFVQGDALVWSWDGIWALLLGACGILFGTMFLYWGLARGPVAVAGPIVSAYPAINLALAVAQGKAPEAVEWGAMLAVMSGVALVAWAAGRPIEKARYSRAHVRITVLVSLAGAVGFALGIVGAQEAAKSYGELQTVMSMRLIGILLLALYFFLYLQRAPAIPGRWWPVLTLQGMLDGGAYVALLFASRGEDAVHAVVIASTFSAITALLARFILKEPMNWLQWVGIGVIVGGVATLSAYG